MGEGLLDRIVVSPRVLAGKPIVRGTRLSVEFLLGLLAQNIPQDEILRDYPTLKPDDLRAVLLYAQRVISGEEVVPLAVDGR